MNVAANRNTFWAHTLVDELARAGLQAVVIAPGSRSTPLALAFGEQTGLRVYLHPDERGAAFFALGIALASRRPAAVLCTSGTATVNFYPAVVESHQSNVPLLVLTADRPAELRDSGSNQTIDQLKLYGGFVRWAVEAPVPEANPDGELIRSLRSLAGRALAATQGIRPGPVHINIPFRKPLEPTPLPGEVPVEHWNVATGFAHARSGRAPFVRLAAPQINPSAEQVDGLLTAIRGARRGLIYCGPRCPGGDFPQAVLRLAQASGFPILAEALSGVRFGSDGHAVPSQQILGGYETFLKSKAFRDIEQPDLVLQFGAVPTSKSLGDYLAGLTHTRRIQIEASGAWADDSFNTSEYLWADPTGTIQTVLEGLAVVGSPAVDQAWSAAFQQGEALAWQALDEIRQEGFFEGALLMDVLDELKDGDSLFLASSLPVRHLDQFGRPALKDLRVHANRGASGIDGTIASAAGVAAASPERRLTLVIGDLAFLHDLNSLLLLHKYKLNLTIVLINNDGGGIFRRLPVAAYEPLFSELFLASHGLKFKHAARLFQLDYVHIANGADFRDTYRKALESKEATIIEVTTDVSENEQARQKLLQRFEHLWQRA